MTVPRLRRRTSPVRRPDRRSDMLRGAAIAMVALRTVVSGLMARGWQETIVRQRDDRLDRAASSRTVTIENVMANYENALQAARPLWLDNALEIAERLRTAQPERTCSLGVAQWDGREDVAALVARADRALYAAKDAGRDRIRVDAPTTAETAAP